MFGQRRDGERGRVDRQEVDSMGGEMNKLWNRYWLWLFRDLMPPPDPLLAYRVTLQEVCRQFGEVLVPTMAEVAIIFRQFAEAAESWEER